MIDKIDISSFDEEIYEIDDIELVFGEDGCYILSNDDYFFISNLQDFIVDENNNYVILNEDKTERLIINQDQFYLIEEIFIKKNLV